MCAAWRSGDDIAAVPLCGGGTTGTGAVKHVFTWRHASECSGGVPGAGYYAVGHATHCTNAARTTHARSTHTARTRYSDRRWEASVACTAVAHRLCDCPHGLLQGICFLPRRKGPIYYATTTKPRENVVQIGWTSSMRMCGNFAPSPNMSYLVFSRCECTATLPPHQHVVFSIFSHISVCKR